MSKNKASRPKKRALSRLMAIQISYQYDFFNQEKKIPEIKEDVIENYAILEEENLTSYRDKIDEAFLDNLLYSVEISDSLNDEIKEFLKTGFTLEKLDEVIQNLLRLAVFELKFMKDIPYKVIIDEYVDLAAAFFENKKITFINGILEQMAKKFRDEEIKNG